MKRLIIAVAVASVFTFIVIGVSSVGSVEPKTYEITDADIEVELQRDGSLVVSEDLTFDFTGNFQGAYREFPLNGEAEVTNVVVGENGDAYDPGGNTALGSFDREGTYGFLSREGRPFRIVWHYDATDEQRTFQVRYRVENAAAITPDSVDVTWTVWGDQWDFWLDHLDATFSAESGVAPTNAWLRLGDDDPTDEKGPSRSLGAEPELTGDRASVSVDRLPEGDNVGMRALFPRDAISSTRGTSSRTDESAEDIIAAEAELDDDLGSFDKLRNFAGENVLLLCLLVAGLGLLSLLGLVVLARERPTNTPEYLPEPPEDIPPALAYALAEEGKYDERLVLATLLDLVDRGYYDARAAADTKDQDLEIRDTADRPQGEALESYEVATVDFFDKLLDSNWVALGQMSDRIPKHSSTWRNRWEDLNEKLDQAEEAHISWDRDFNGLRALIVVGVLIGLGAVAVLAYSRTHLLAVPLVTLVWTLLLIFAVPGPWLKRLMPGPRARQAQWAAFEEWTRDFPRLDDDPPSTLKLWRRILVYAVAFDTAERVAKSGRIPAPVVEEASSSGLWTGYAVGSGFGHGFGGFSSGFSSQVAPESTSSGGGGGGFSGGGGGGFSGGGGGGAW